MIDILPLSQPAASGVKFIYFRQSDGFVYRTDTLGFEAWSDLNYSHYLTTATQQGTSLIYLATTPANVAATAYMFVGKITVDSTPTNDQNAGAGQFLPQPVVYVTPGAS